MVVEDLFVIISEVPERISKYTSNLRSFTSNFQFFSDVSSFTKGMLAARIKLLILDRVDVDACVVAQIRALLHLSTVEIDTIFVIVQTGRNEEGVAALNAGANDYLMYSLVNNELAVRARMHLNRERVRETVADTGFNLDGVYPREDRFIIRTAIYCIRNNIGTIRRLSDLSACVGKSDREINKAFTRHLGMTASEYIRDCRIEMAKKLLFKTRISITQIADSVGYSSSANFSTAFKTSVGQSPREFRQQQMSNK